MKRLLVALSLVVLLCGCASHRNALSPPKDVVDRDFVAMIQKTKEPYVFEISVRQINKKPGKAISGFPAVADLILKDSNGKIYAAKSWEKPQYAKEIGDVFSTVRKVSAKPLTGRVRLVKNNLPPGKYTVQPHVQIPEVAIIIDYPAGNSVEITIK